MVLNERRGVAKSNARLASRLIGRPPALDVLADQFSKMGVELKFNSIEDFEPDQVVQQVEPLRKLVEARQKLADLRSKMDGNEKLETMLEDIIQSSDKQKELSSALGIDAKEE